LIEAGRTFLQEKAVVKSSQDQTRQAHDTFPSPYLERTPPHLDSTYIICFTTGTTGVPKGAMISHKNIISSVSSGRYLGMVFDETDIYSSYVPLSHIQEQILFANCLINASQIGYPRFSGNFQNAIDPEMLL
jgi:long-subunit acyl-CoA synthetase (AMP-forming)